MADAEVVHRNNLECGCTEFWYRRDEPECTTPASYGYGLGISSDCPHHKHYLVQLSEIREQDATG